MKTRNVTEHAQGVEPRFAFQYALRVVVIKQPDELIKGAIVLGCGQGEQDVAHLLRGVPFGEAEFGHDVFGVGGKLQVACLAK